MANWNLDDYSYRGITTPVGFIRNLFFDGFHPVFPWVAFHLFGMWLGRTDLRSPDWRRLLAIRAGVAVTEPLVSTGQLALTIYLAHVFFGMGILEGMGRLENQSLEWAVSTGLAFSAAAVAFSWAWRRRFRPGPLEWVMRRVAG